MDNQSWEAVRSCEKYKCKVVDRTILLTSIMVPWFCAGVSGYDTVLGRWRRWEDLFVAVAIYSCLYTTWTRGCMEPFTEQPSVWCCHLGTFCYTISEKKRTHI